MKNFTFKAFAVFLFVFGLSVEGRGQYVTIPDASFRAELMYQFPSCFNGQGQMDTTCWDIVGAISVAFDGANIINLDGIQYFDNLTDLYCRYNPITTLPLLPNSLIWLDCSSNHLTQINSLPPNLTSLNIAHNNFVVLPNLMGSSLTNLDCSYNNLDSLPPLPNYLISLNCSHANISQLPILPIQLQNFFCNHNSLSVIPSLPNQLQYLNCDYNNLSVIPSLPNSLTNLSCSANQLDSLPELSATNLQGLVCNANHLIAIPQLPLGLISLSCSYNPLSNNLPTLPNSLNYLYCISNHLTNIPSLPPSLRELFCDNNNLASLPTLPNSLLILRCQGNSIQSLPQLSNTLQQLDCYNNNILILPSLPNSLTQLNCSGNNLSSLPVLPNGLTSLTVNNNNLSCLPLLPSTLGYLQTGYGLNDYTMCLPNLPPNCAYCHLHPLCLDPTLICPGSAFCVGTVFEDANNDGIMNNGETTARHRVLSANPGNHSSASTALGYRLEVDTVATSTVSVMNPYPLSINFVPPSHQVISNGAAQVPGNYDFAMQYIPNVEDLEVSFSHGPVRPGFNTGAYIRVFNAGTVVDSPLVTLDFPPDWVVLNTSPQGTVNGNTVTWQDTALAIFTDHNFSVQFNIPAFVPIGTNFTYTASVPQGNDVAPANNIYTANDIVTGSYDPNDKSCGTTELFPGYDPDEELFYTVRFQNTGNDTAFTVSIRDTLSTALRANTLRVVNASHDFEFYYLDFSRVLYVIFRNINLVDSFANEPLSHGFVQFAVKPQPNLPIGTSIENAADIYFDFNAPVRTNTVTTNVDIVSVPQLASNTALKIYPNPTNGRVRIQAPEALVDGVEVVIADMMGRACLSVPCMGSGADVSMDGLPSGVYSASVVNQGRILYRGLVLKK